MKTPHSYVNPVTFEVPRILYPFHEITDYEEMFEEWETGFRGVWKRQSETKGERGQGALTLTFLFILPSRCLWFQVLICCPRARCLSKPNSYVVSQRPKAWERTAGRRDWGQGGGGWRKSSCLQVFLLNDEPLTAEDAHWLAKALFKIQQPGSSHHGSVETNLTSIHEDVGPIPGLAQWVKDPALLWLWYRPAAVLLTRPLAWEPPYASGVALKSKVK